MKKLARMIVKGKPKKTVTRDTALKQSSISNFSIGLKRKNEPILNQPAKKIKRLGVKE